jgi:hypothetical protein
LRALCLAAALALVAGVFPAFAASDAAIVTNRVTKSDVDGHEDMKLRTSHPHLFLFDEGDYDGDGVKDAAAFVKTSDRKVDAIVIMGGSGQIYRLETGIDLKTLMPRMGLQTVGPAVFETACGKGSGFDDGVPCEASITTRRDAVMLFVFEVGEILYVWDGKGFQETIISD